VVSRAIAQLEHTLGVRLLERNPHGVELTAYGRALIARSRVAFDELRQGVKDIEFLADPTVGEVRIGSTSPLAASFVSAGIDRLSRRHPGVSFQVEVGQSEAVRRQLIERELDLLVVRRFAAWDDQSLAFEVLYDNPYVVAAGVDSPWVRRRKLEFRELAEERWALPPRHSDVGRIIERAFRASGVPFPRPAVIAFAHEMRINLVATARYLTVLPESLLTLPGKHPLLARVPVALPVASGPIGILTLTTREPSPVAQLFATSAREVAQSLGGKSR
jgi:DNA-binding transcriptional LysR family regulator